MKTGGERWTHECIRLHEYALYQGILLVYNYCLRWTFEKLDAWLDYIRQHSPEECVIMVVGNKYVHKYMTDDREVSFEEGQHFADQNGLSFFEITDHNQQTLLDEKFLELVGKAHEKQKEKLTESVSS